MDDEDKPVNRQLGQSLNVQFNPTCCISFSIVIDFCIAHCNIYIYIQVYYPYPHCLPEDLGYHCSYLVC